MATKTNSTELDDLKDLVSDIVRGTESIDSYLAFNDIYVDENPELESVDTMRIAAIKTLARRIPGMSCAHWGQPLYETEEARTAANTYDDGTPVVERFSFPDVDGLSFEYRPRHDKPRDEFMKWAREAADQHAADVHARYVNVGGLGIEFTGAGDDAFSVHLGEDDRTSLSREQTIELRAGLTRILAKQARTDLHMGLDRGEEWADANEIHGNDGAVHLTPQLGPQFGICIESYDANGAGEVAMSLAEARHLAERLLALADGLENQYEEPVHPDALRGLKEIHAENQSRVPEILAALAAGGATTEQLANVVELPNGRVKTWAHVTTGELEELRRVHSF